VRLVMLVSQTNRSLAAMVECALNYYFVSSTDIRNIILTTTIIIIYHTTTASPPLLLVVVTGGKGGDSGSKGPYNFAFLPAVAFFLRPAR